MLVLIPSPPRPLPSHKTVELVGNAAKGGPDPGSGVGSGLALVERCSEGPCTPVQATALLLNATQNYAAAAGGAVFYSSAGSVGFAGNSSLAVTESLLVENRVEWAAEGGEGRDGVGGGLYIGRPVFSLLKCAAPPLPAGLPAPCLLAYSG